MKSDREESIGKASIERAHVRCLNHCHFHVDSYYKLDGARRVAADGRPSVTVLVDVESPTDHSLPVPTTVVCITVQGQRRDTASPIPGSKTLIGNLRTNYPISGEKY